MPRPAPRPPALLVLLKDAGDKTLVKCAWVGDSRAILCFKVGGEIFELSSDHKADDEAEHARLSRPTQCLKRHFQRRDFFARHFHRPERVELRQMTPNDLSGIRGFSG